MKATKIVLFQMVELLNFGTRSKVKMHNSWLDSDNNNFLLHDGEIYQAKNKSGRSQKMLVSWLCWMAHKPVSVYTYDF